MSNALTQTFQRLFGAQHPHWACEFTTRQVIVAGVDRKRSEIQGRSVADLADGTDLQNFAGARDVVERALTAAAFRGSDIAVVIPDDAARISFITADSMPKTVEEQQTFLRWKLKKSVPFDVETAQIAFRVVRANKPSGYELVVALAPRTTVEKYENLMEKLDIHAGFVVPSTLAAVTLMPPADEDSLFVKIAPDCVTTTVFQNKQMTFYRRVSELGLYESIYPTILYYQDKLGGNAFQRMVVCADDAVPSGAVQELSERVGIPAVPLQPRNIEDIYKPALGAVHLSWANSI